MARNPASLSRRIAHKVLLRVYEDGAFADRALAAALDRTEAQPRDRAFATELVYGVLRHNRHLDFYIRKYSSRRLKKIQIGALVALRIGAYELLFLSTPSHSAVDEAVNLLQQASKKIRGFANGILRELGRHKEANSLPLIQDAFDNPIEGIAVQNSIPTEILERVAKRRDQQATAEWAKLMGKPAPFTIRVNSLKTTPSKLQTHFEKEDIRSELNHATPYSLDLHQPGNLGDNLSFIRGEFSVQDIASQLVCHLVDPKPGQKIVDLCAAPGGKTTFLAELSGDKASILGFDLYPGRVGLIQKATARLGLSSIEAKTLDTTNTPMLKKQIEEWANSEGVDRVLVDAPCSGLGTLRRNPDMRLRTTNIEELCEIQRDILKSADAILQPGGFLIYSVCTFTNEESIAIISDYLNKYPNYQVVPIEGEIFQPFKSKRTEIFDGEFIETWTDLHQCDGFFAIKLQKQS